MKRRLAAWMRKWADRIDDDGAPRYVGVSFTFENRKGLVVHLDGKRGCPLWYLSKTDYMRAHAEAETDHAIVDWVNGTSRFGR